MVVLSNNNNIVLGQYNLTQRLLLVIPAGCSHITHSIIVIDLVNNL